MTTRKKRQGPPAAPHDKPATRAALEALLGIYGPKEGEPLVELPVELAERMSTALFRAAALQKKLENDTEDLGTHIRLKADTGNLRADIQALRDEAEALRDEAEALREELRRLPVILPKRERPAPLPVRIGKPLLGTLNATPKAVMRKRRAKGLTGADEEAEKLFLKGETYRPLGMYERAAIIGLANLARDAGVLEALDTAKMPRRIVDPDRVSVDDRPSVRIPFPSYADIARRAGAPVDAAGRIPQNYTRGIETAIERLTKEERLIAEPVKLVTDRGLVDTYEVCATKWLTKVEVIDPDGELGAAKRTALVLDGAACTAMIADGGWMDRPLLADYERARKAIGARELRDDLVALEDYLTWRRNTELGKRRGVTTKAATKPARGKGGRGKAPANHAPAPLPAEVPAPAAATEADRVVVVTVAKAELWKVTGLARYAAEAGAKKAQEREDQGLAFCKARGLLVAHEERDGEKERVLVLTLAASPHPDPTQGTLFLPGGEA